MSVTELAGLVNALADTARRGGRCTVVDDTRCILYADWDAMQRMSDAINAELIAAFLAQESSGLNQISVLQDTTTVVEEALSGYSYTARNTPGFLVSNLSYARLPEDEWGAAQHLWRIATHFYAPPGFTSALFATRGHAATSPALHACAQSTDVCCLHRMNLDHRMGDFGAWVTENLTPLCTATGGFPGAAVAVAPSETTLAAVAGEAWLTGCSNWNTAMHNDVLARFHTCLMTVSPLESSVSGFIVIFDLSSPPQRMRTAFLVLGATAALCTATWHLARALAPDVDLWPPFLNLSAPFLDPVV